MPDSPAPLRNAATVDLEDWYQGIEQPAENWPRYAPRLHTGTARLLDILAETDTRATFFVLGWQAERYPTLVRRIAEAGHEIATHGYDHTKFYRSAPAKLRETLSRAKKATEDVVGRAIHGHRAPYFSLTRRTLWAIDILAELGIRFDSSVYPGTNWRYGVPGSPRGLYLLGESGIVEFPVSTFSIKIRTVGIGGAYFRILPLWVTARGLRAINAEGRPAMLYVHPWELDPGHPVVRFHWKAMATHYFNLRATAPRLRRLLSTYPFTTMSEVIKDERARRDLPRVVLQKH